MAGGYPHMGLARLDAARLANPRASPYISRIANGASGSATIAGRSF